jgi:hypothetical protein
MVVLIILTKLNEDQIGVILLVGTTALDNFVIKL